VRWDPYGSFLPALLWADLRDRCAGRPQQANARWGFVRPPSEGKTIWIVAASHPRSVRLGVELVRAIRQKRLDVRLVFTFEQEYPWALAPLRGSARTGWGFGPCDHPLAVERTLRRLKPLGIVFAGVSPRPHLARATARLSHRLLVAAIPGPAAVYERIYPSTEEEAACAGSAAAPAANLLTLVMPSQVDPNFAALVNGPAHRSLWWWHGVDPRALEGFLASFRALFPRDPLFVTGLPLRQASTLKPVAISHWDRTPLPDGALVAVDDPAWLPAVAAACVAAHFDARDDEHLWQALGGGAVASRRPGIPLPKAALACTVPERVDAGEVVVAWQAWQQNPHLQRELKDRARQAFWAERRLAGSVRDELLERIFNWD
jgi:hypothetical protein